MTSKLEMYIDILNVLEQRGPLRVPSIADEIAVSCYIVNGSLEFLIKQGLVEERIDGKSAVYTNTARGRQVTKFFVNLSKALPVKETDDKILSLPY